MVRKEKTYFLKHSPEGFRLLLDRDSDQVISEDWIGEPPGMSTLVKPRWSHWRQRKLARPMHATLLGMNIEPIPDPRPILKAHAPEIYQMYRDRNDILLTLIGYEIEYFEDHVRETDGANGKYIELATYCKYAESLGWSGLSDMRAGLCLDDNPPVLKINVRQESNLLRFVDSVLRCAVPKYSDGKSRRSPSAVIDWLQNQDETVSVSEPTLRNWFKTMELLDLPDDN